MLHGRWHEFRNPARRHAADHRAEAGAVIRRLLRDYVSGQWGLLAAGHLLHAARLGAIGGCCRSW